MRNNNATGTITGIITVTTAGTEVTGPDQENSGGFLVRNHPSNTGTVWVMTTGAAKTAGYGIKTGEQAYVGVLNLNTLDFDADVSGEKVCWMKA